MDSPTDIPRNASELSVSTEPIRLAVQRVDALRDRSTALAARTEQFTAEDLGHDAVTDALRGFVGEWNHQIYESRNYLGELADRLDDAATSYRQADTSVVDALRPLSSREQAS